MRLQVSRIALGHKSGIDKTHLHPGVEPAPYAIPQSRSLPCRPCTGFMLAPAFHRPLFLEQYLLDILFGNSGHTFRTWMHMATLHQVRVVRWLEGGTLSPTDAARG